MNAWLAAAAAPGRVLLGRPGRLATTLVTLALILLAEGFGRSSYFVVGLTLAALGFVGNLAFVRFMEREL